MKSLNRRNFVKYLAAAPIGLALLPNGVEGMDCKVQHPFMPPKEKHNGQCPVCGMVRSMWARTCGRSKALQNCDYIPSFVLSSH